jgi:hypothetical protein
MTYYLFPVWQSLIYVRICVVVCVNQFVELKINNPMHFDVKSHLIVLLFISETMLQECVCIHLSCHLLM